jgi:hypothetical protein
MVNRDVVKIRVGGGGRTGRKGNGPFIDWGYLPLRRRDRVARRSYVYLGAQWSQAVLPEARRRSDYIDKKLKTSQFVFVPEVSTSARR